MVIRSFFWFGFWGFLGVIALFLVFVGVLFLFGRLIYLGAWHVHRRTQPWYTRHDEALEILRTRYARGEISKEQYLETKKVLEER